MSNIEKYIREQMYDIDIHKKERIVSKIVRKIEYTINEEKLLKISKEKKCQKCGKEWILADIKNKYIYKYNCDCVDKNLRISIG